MATKYPIIKNMSFFSKLLICFISANNDDMVHRLLPDTYDHKLMLNTINDLERSKFKVTPMIHCFSKVLLYLIP